MDVFNQVIKDGLVFYLNDNIADEGAIVSVEVHTFHIDMMIARHYFSDTVHHAKGIHTCDLKGGLKITLGCVYPEGFDDAVIVITLHLKGIRAIGFVDFDALVNGQKSKNIIPGIRITAGRYFVV